MRRPLPHRARAAAFGLASAFALLGSLIPSAAAAADGRGADRTGATTTIVVSPHGAPPHDTSSHGAGAAPTPKGDHRVGTLSAAQDLARRLADRHDVVVVLEGGTHEMRSPLRFTAADGGRNGHTVTWTSAPGQRAVLSGGSAVSGWSRHDAAKNIWVAPVPRGTQSRQLYVDGKVAPRTSLRLAADKHDRGHLEFTERGITLKDPALSHLNSLPNQSDLEIESVGSFTDRISPVKAIRGNEILMQQPAWDNNTFGYDTLTAPYARGALYLNNSYAFLNSAGQWYLDSSRGLLYYRAAAGATMHGLDVRLPRLQSLVQVAGTYDRPVANLAFRNLQFSDTTWLDPSSPQGYVDQQSGAHVVGTYARPADALSSCQDGCPKFEATRNEWHQIPAAVQVSAARDVSFTGNSFTRLGDVGLGLGMDPNAHASGVGYGAADITVHRNSFTESAASAIVVGGVQPDAHHPRDSRMVNHDVSIVDNTITGISQDYKDNAAILSTYTTRATIAHNSISDVPYDGIDIGWGWGINDPGGNGYYREAGLYEYQPIYTTPTTFRDNVVSHNLIHDTKQVMNDGGSVYTLSASPGTVIERNYIYDNKATLGVLIDQGTRHVVMRDNVVIGASRWVYVNADAEDPDTFNTKDNLITGNWWDVGPARNPEGPGYDNQLVDNVQVADGVWPAEARSVMQEAGAHR
ncbi:right-handed parallel beta-helix repeat-containing protein [Streptomyces formicae]|uniref:Right-handed parallel beta-helix repeat-containing protein n=1 Tax=Streptomyces formicae TaxID=1616117 RepID=A0ABY3WVE1_9ACTN|nr:right-handed parallel beta-helix repeat-containing protein [Streptomyces formicae]